MRRRVVALLIAALAVLAVVFANKINLFGSATKTRASVPAVAAEPDPPAPPTVNSELPVLAHASHSSVQHGSKTPAKNSPIEPVALYRRNIQRAKEGNARSQYRVFQALQSCRGAIRTEDRLDEVLRTQSLTDKQIEDIKLRFDRCKDFATLAPDIDGEITKWLHLAAENGDPFAKAYESILSYPNYDVDELRALIKTALETNDPEAYSFAAMYYANVTTNDNDEVFEAWNLISCEVEPNCDVGHERDRIKLQYQMYERAQISSTESELRNKLRSKQWDELGF